MKRLLGFLFVSLLFGSVAVGQTAVVTHDVNLRPDPSTNGVPLAKLAPGAKLELLESQPTKGFLHVKAEDGTEGWVWRNNVKTQTTVAAATVHHVGPASLYPDPNKTTGLADTLSSDDLTRTYTEHCPSHKTTCTYSQAHRNVPSAEHKHVYDEYNVPPSKRNKIDGEVDHFYPLCAGGSNKIENLWYQPAINMSNGENFGFHEKDKLETYICVQITNGKLDPKEAFDRMTQDWVKFYQDEGLDDVN